MRLEDIEYLWDRLERSTVNELSLEMEGVKLHLRKGEAPVVGGAVAYAPVAAPSVVPILANEADAPVANAEPVGEAVTSPIVGTFYAAPAPGEAPFVTVGSKVSAGDVIGIVEAMKLMNEITTQRSGVVVAVEAVDGEMVQYGQTLVRIADAE